MDALVKGLEKRAYALSKSENSWHPGTAAKGQGYEFMFRIRKPAKRQPHPQPHSWRPRYDLVLTGKLQLEIDFMIYRSTRMCRNRAGTRIEDYVWKVPWKMLLLIEEYRREEATRDQQRRQQEEIRQREEEVVTRKARREKHLRECRERRESLFRTAEQWHRLQLLREFIETVRVAVVERMARQKLHPDTIRWLEWATKTANRADPIEQMKEESDRPKRLRKPK
jgi:hypothetical protein